MSSPGGIQTSSQMFTSFVPKVEITKVSLSYSNTEQAMGEKTLEALYDRNPHLDLSATEIAVALSGVGQTQKARSEHLRTLGQNQSTTIRVDLKITVPQGTSIFPSVLQEDLIKDTLEVHVCGYTGDQAHTYFTKEDISNKNFGAAPIVFQDWGQPESITQSDGSRAEIYTYTYNHPIAGEVNNLGIITYASLNADTLLSGLQGQGVSSDITMNSILGPKDSLWVLDSGKIASTTLAYVDSKGNVWDGPVHSIGTSPTARGELKTKLEERKNLITAYAPVNKGGVVVNNEGYLWLLETRRPTGGGAIPAGFLNAWNNYFSRINGFMTPNSEYNWKVGIDVTRPASGNNRWWSGFRRPAGWKQDWEREAKQFLEREVANIDEQLAWLTGLGGLSQELWMSGPAGASTTIVLSQKTIKVPKVQDFRIAHEIESIPLDFAITEKDIFPNLTKDLYGNRLLPRFDPDYFSEIYLSRDIDNQCRYFFSIDWQKILYENSIFGQLIKDAGGPEFAELLNKTKIQNLKITRRRIEGSGEAGSNPYPRPMSGKYFDPVNNPRVFDENQVPEVIVEKSDGLSGGIASDSDFIEMRDHFDKSGTEYIHRHFSGIDTSVAKKTDGYYKYEVEIECLDASVEIIEEKLNDLIEDIDVIKSYYDAATKLSSRTGGVPPSYSPYLDIPGERHQGAWSFEKEYQPGDINPGAFDTKLNRFTDNFIDNPQGHWKRNEGTIKNAVSGQPTTGPESFYQILQFFSKAVVGDNIRLALIDFIDPNSATPESIHTVIQLMQTVASRIESIIGVANTSSESAGYTDEPTDAQSHVSPKNRLYKVRHQSFGYFDASQRRNFGLDFFGSSGARSGPGLRRIRPGKIDTRGDGEALLFFSEMAADDVVDLPEITLPNNYAMAGTIKVKSSSATYFTPEDIYLPSGQIHMDFTSDPRHPAYPTQAQKYLSILPYTLLKNINTTTPQGMLDLMQSLRPALINLPDQDRFMFVGELASYFSLYHNAVVLPEHESINRDIDYSRSTDEKDRAQMYAILMDILESASFTPSKPNKILSLNTKDKFRNVKYFYDLDPVATGPQPGSMAEALVALHDAHYPTFDDIGWLQEAPVQIKGLIFFASTSRWDILNPWFHEFMNKPSDDQNQNYDYGPAFEYTTQIINRLEILTGYGSNTGVPGADQEQMLKAPIWKPYWNRGTLERDRTYLCRISPYVDDKYLITRDERYDLPTYDEYFIMKAD